MTPKYSSHRATKTPENGGKKQRREYATNIEDMSTTSLAGFSPEDVTPAARPRQPEFSSTISRVSRNRESPGAGVDEFAHARATTAAMEMADYFRQKHGEKWMDLPEFSMRRR